MGECRGRTGAAAGRATERAAQPSCPTTPPAEPVASAEWAVRQTQAALDGERFSAARRWIGRAARLMPDETTVQLMLASATFSSDLQRALSLLERLVERHPGNRDAGVALAATFMRSGRPADAASCLASLLGRLVPPDDPAFCAVASAICAGSGAPGWVWVDGQGMCAVRLIGAAAGCPVRLALDGEPAGVVQRGQRAQALPGEWRRAGRLTAAVRGQPLLGSGLDPSWFARVDGFVSAEGGGGVRGWARLSADPANRPALFLRQPGGALGPVAFAAEPKAVDRQVGHQAARWAFAIDADALRGLAQAEVVDGEGRHLWGSPLALGGEQAASRAAAQGLAAVSTGQGAAASPVMDRFRPLSAALLPVPPRPGVKPARLPPCDVIVPVHGGAAELELCLASLAETLPRTARLVLIDDGSPDPRIRARLRAAERAGVTVLAHSHPRGFPAAVNAGFAHLRPESGRDVVILNADTIVSRHWLTRLSAVAHSDPAIGSCTPLTNDGTIVCYPAPGEAQDAPAGASLGSLNDCCWQANGGEAVPIPTGVGFCMLIKGECLAETGWFREDVFAQGYGEENDWCLRAAHLGWRHAAAPGVFVAHSGGRSFGAAKTLLMARNAAVLERLHPGYEAYVKAALADDPLLPSRRRADRLRLLQAAGHGAVALVTHGAGGGVARHVARRSAAIARSGRRPIVLSPKQDEPGVCCVSLGGDDGCDLPNLYFTMPGEQEGLTDLLRDAGVEAVEIHHLLGHHQAVGTLPAALGVPYDVYVHDYGHWCPRISLTSRGNRYCGEPLSEAECEECVADLGSRYDPSVTVTGLRQSSALLLGQARRVLVSCEDVAARIRRQFPAIRPMIEAWDDAAPAAAEHHHEDDGIIHVVIAGAIGIEKGYDVLLACARDATRRALPLRFTVVGHTIDDGRLMSTGCAFVTGRFEESEGLALVGEQDGVIGFVPSVCPETWCFALSLLWQAGLPVLGFALGAQGERIGQSGRGWLLPPGLPPAKINDALVSRGIERLHRSRHTIVGH